MYVYMCLIMFNHEGVDTCFLADHSVSCSHGLQGKAASQEDQEVSHLDIEHSVHVCTCISGYHVITCYTIYMYMYMYIVCYNYMCVP